MLDLIEKKAIKVIQYVIIQCLIVALLFYMKSYNYNLFHVFAEGYSIAVSLTIFFIVINSKQYFDNNFLRLLSIGYFFIIWIDSLHMLAFKGMNIFAGYDANLPTQLWIFSRYIESMTLLIAAILFNKKIDTRAVYGIYLTVTLVGLIAIFARKFPNAFVVGTGLTPFKIVSEYVIITIITIAFFNLRKKKDKFNKDTLQNCYLSFTFSILTELMFTFYSDPFDVVNLLGHYFKILSVYFIYKAVIEVAVKNPQNIIFREIEVKKEELEKEVKDNIINLEKLNRSKTALIKSMQDLVFVLNDQLIFTECYSPESNLLYVKPDRMLNKHIDEIGFPEPAMGIMKVAVERTLQSGEPSRAEYYLDLPQGQCWFDAQITVIPGISGTIEKILCIVRDITEHKRMEKIIYNEKEQYKTTLLSVGDGVISTDNQGKITIMNPIAEKLTGWSKEEALRKPLEDVFCVINEITKETCDNPAQKVLETGSIIELSNHSMLLSKMGPKTSIEDSASPIKDSGGKTTGVVIVFRDCSERKERQKQIEHLSFHDHLTGLYNRSYIEDAVKRLDTQRNLPFTIMVLDVNGLKLTNDAFGHEMGDRLLKTVADIMREVCRADDIVGRVGGDEFAILLPNTDETQAEAVKQRITAITSKTTLDSVIVSLAVGFAVKTNKDQDIEIIKINADNNMYNNKLRYGKTMRNQTIETVLRNINLKYDQEQIHTERVSQYCEAIARAMGFSEKEIGDVKTAGILHDIGKITIPSELLNKPSKLTKEEFEVIKRHPETGYQMLRSVDNYISLAESVLYHHERWDGKGYPCGLKGDDIPLEARIIAVADVYEAMTAKRSYQRTKSKEEAIAELERCSGTQFDPNIVKVFVEKVL